MGNDPSEQWIERYEAIQERVEDALDGDDVHVAFSAYKNDINGLAIDNLDDVAFSGKIRFEYREEGDAQPTYISDVLANPTWLQIAIVANRQLATTEDTDHTYLEGFDVVSTEGDVAVARLFMGS